MVKKLKAMVQQGVDVVLFQNGQYRTTVASIETQYVLKCFSCSNTYVNQFSHIEAYYIRS